MNSEKNATNQLRGQNNKLVAQRESKMSDSEENGRNEAKYSSMIGEETEQTRLFTV